MSDVRFRSSDACWGGEHLRCMMEACRCSCHLPPRCATTPDCIYDKGHDGNCWTTRDVERVHASMPPEPSQEHDGEELCRDPEHAEIERRFRSAEDYVDKHLEMAHEIDRLRAALKLAEAPFREQHSQLDCAKEIVRLEQALEEIKRLVTVPRRITDDVGGAVYSVVTRALAGKP